MSRRVTYFLFCIEIYLDLVDLQHVLSNYPFHWKDRNLFTGMAINILTLDSEVDPVRFCQVDCLSNVQSGRKPRVIGAREVEDKFTWFLEGLIYFYLRFINSGILITLFRSKYVGEIMVTMSISRLGSFLKSN